MQLLFRESPSHIFYYFFQDDYNEGIKSNSTTLTSSGDLEAVHSLLAMSQWSPPSPPGIDTRTKGEDCSDNEKSTQVQQRESTEKVSENLSGLNFQGVSLSYLFLFFEF